MLEEVVESFKNGHSDPIPKPTSRGPVLSYLQENELRFSKANGVWNGHPTP